MSDITGLYFNNQKVNDFVFKYLFLVVVIIIIIFLILHILKQIKIEGETFEQRTLHRYFNNTAGEQLDENARNVIAAGEEIKNPRAIDHYRIGQVYLINARNIDRAHHHFEQALTQIADGKVDTREAPFILERIDDFKDRFFENTDIDNNIQTALLALYNMQNEQNKNVASIKYDIKSDDPEFKQKTILSRQNWQSDSQNVHDHSIYTSLDAQFNYVKKENKQIDASYDEVVNFLRDKYKNDKENRYKLELVLEILNHNYPVGYLSHANEQDILLEVWKRTKHPVNIKNSFIMQNAVADAILDCVENEHPVCMAGRISKIWQALACLDADENLGVLKSKQVLRNEIYQKAAKIVDSYIGENGSVSADIKKEYNDGKMTNDVLNMIDNIKKDIYEIKKDYAELMNDTHLDTIINECQNVI
jgi:hypothetical protein